VPHKAVLLCLVATCEAGQEIVQYAKIRKVVSLSGTVTDATGAAIPEVRVCEMSPKWKTELQCTNTDSEGRWLLAIRKGTMVYPLRLAKDNFNQVWIRVRLTKKGRAACD